MRLGLRYTGRSVWVCFCPIVLHPRVCRSTDNVSFEMMTFPSPSASSSTSAERFSSAELFAHLRVSRSHFAGR
eukprot:2925389-Rhodomonas_salina.4